jgi:sulfatase modifying factor 1
MPKLDLTFRGAALLALALTACHYDPIVPEGAQCRANSDCPAGYGCRPKPNTDISVCCRTAQCGFNDEQAPPDAAPPAPDAPVADKPMSPSPDLREASVAVDVGAEVSADGPAAELAAEVGPDLAAPDLAPEVSPDTAPACPASQGGPALVRAESFCIDSTEVTNQQYAAFLAAKGSDVSGQPAACKWNNSYLPSTDGLAWPFLNGRANYPVANVDWCDAFMFCRWAGKRLCGKVGGGRLTTVAAAAGPTGQWMNACTNAGRLIFPYGMTLQRATCNIDAASDAAMYVEEVQHRASCQGGYPGLYDMGGNLEEWVDGCDRDTGSNDDCAIAGSASFTGALTNDDLTCHGSVFGAPRNTRYYLLGIRCCAD